MVKAFSGKSGTSNGVASPAMNPDPVLKFDNLLFASGRSGLREGTSGLDGATFFFSLPESLFKMWKILTIEGLLGRIYVIGVATSMGEHAASETSKISISSR